jgi:hypothetical protein
MRAEFLFQQEAICDNPEEGLVAKFRKPMVGLRPGNRIQHLVQRSRRQAGSDRRHPASRPHKQEHADGYTNRNVGRSRPLCPPSGQTGRLLRTTPIVITTRSQPPIRSCGVLPSRALFPFRPHAWTPRRCCRAYLGLLTRQHVLIRCHSCHEG